jgi:O-antigen/teichoic acid export membrane protein
MSNAFGKTAALKGVIWTTGSTYATYILGLLTSVLIARRLGVDDFGRYSYFIWLCGILVLIANNGLNNTAIKFVSEAIGRNSIENADAIYGWLRRLQYGFTILSGALFLALFPWIKPTGWNEQISFLVVAALVAFSFKATSMFNTAVAKGYGRFAIEAITNTGAILFNTVFVVVLACLHAPLEAYVALFAITSIVYALFSIFLLRRQGITPHRAVVDPSWLQRVRPHLFWTASMTAISIAGSRSIETFLLNRWVGAAEVGFFSIATALNRAGIELLVAGLSTVMMPIMGFLLGVGNHERTQRVFGDATRYYQYLGLLIAGVGMFWARDIVTIMYGAKYMPVILIFRITVASAGVLLANGAFAAVLGASDNQRFRIGVTVLGAVISWLVALQLIPLYGAIGAALAQSASSVLSTIVIVVGIQKFIGLRLPWSSLAKQYAVALIAGVLGLLTVLATGGALASEFAGGLVYAIVLLVLPLFVGIWRQDEKRYAIELLSKHPRVGPIIARFSHSSDHDS